MHAILLRIFSRILPVLAFWAVGAYPGFSQTVPAAAVDLNAPSLGANAELPRYFRPGPPLTTSLPYHHTKAVALGIEWKGLMTTMHDAESDVAGYNDRNPTALGIYQRLACQSSLIVIGHSTVSQSHLSASETSVYTDYDFVIDQLIKDNTISPVASPDIVVTRPGGSLAVNGDPVSFISVGFPALQPGSRYLIFLVNVPASKAYQPADSYSTLVSGNEGAWLIARQSPGGQGFTNGKFETSITNWLKSCN